MNIAAIKERDDVSINCQTPPTGFLRDGFAVTLFSGPIILCKTLPAAESISRLLGGQITRASLAFTSTSRNRGMFGCHSITSLVQKHMKTLSEALAAREEADESRDLLERIDRCNKALAERKRAKRSAKKSKGKR